MPVEKFFFLATLHPTHDVIVAMDPLYVRSRTHTDRQQRLVEPKEKLPEWKCNTNRHGWSLDRLEDRAMDSFLSQGLLGDERLYGLVGGGGGATVE